MGTVRASVVYLAAVATAAGCGEGALELTLALPSQADLRPAGMTTVTITATAPGESPIGNTSVLASGRVNVGDLPVGDDIQIGVVLRDVSNRIVGVGEAGQAVDIVGDKTVKLAIPVRRPFVYAASGTSLYSFDPTLDPRDAKFQGQLAGVSGPQFTVSVGGDRLAVVSGNAVQVVVTETNSVMGMITVPAMVSDAAAVPGTHKLAVAHGQGIAIVDLDAGSVTNAAVGPVDRVTVGRGSDGVSLVAYGLVGRVAPPDKPPMLSTCTGSSKVVAVSVDDPQAASPVALPAGVSDLAAAPDAPMLFASLPCSGKVSKIQGVIEGGTASLMDVADLERASVLTVAGDRVWAAGTKSSTPACTSGCTPTTPVACPQPSGNHLAYVTEGARVIVKSIPLDGGMPITLEVPGRRETMVDVGDEAKQHAQVLKALGVVPVDLVTLPGGQYVALVTKSRYYIEELRDPLVGAILPCLDAVTGDWILIDMASSSVAQRVRTACNLITGPAAVFDMWACDDPPEGERNKFPMSYLPTSVGALFGSR